MKYYAVKYSLNPKIVGTQYPQVWDFVKGYKPEVKDNGLFSLYNMYNDGFPLSDPNLSGLKLSNGSKFTDFMSGGFGDYLFILSEKSKTLLEKMKLEEHRFYSAKIVSLRKKLEKDYYIMKIKSTNIKFVDFKRSTFLRQGRYDGKQKGQVEIDSIQDYQIKDKIVAQESNWKDGILSTSIKMLPSFYTLELDLFKIGEIDYQWYVSSSLYHLISEMNLTGLEFSECDL